MFYIRLEIMAYKRWSVVDLRIDFFQAIVFKAVAATLSPGMPFV